MESDVGIVTMYRYTDKTDVECDEGFVAVYR